MVAMLLLQALLRRVLQLLVRSAVARRVALLASVGLVLLVGLQTDPPAEASDGAAAAAVPESAASARLSAPCAEIRAGRRWAELARRGDLEALAALADGGGGGYNDAQAYKWLSAAADFGHARAEAMANGLLEATSLRFDDGGLLVGQMHHELGLSYLGACEGWPHNLQWARKHLALGREGVLGTEHDFAADRRGLAADALKVFDEVFPPGMLAAGESGSSAADAASGALATPRATASAATSPPASAARTVLTARMVDFGLYRTRRFGRRAGADVAGGLVGTSGLELLRQADRVPAAIGTAFGFRYVLMGPREEAEITVRVLHPVPLRDPESGRGIAVSEWQQRLPIGQVNWNSGWVFEHPWELVPGRWTIQLHGKAGLLLEKHFDVVLP